MSGAGGDGKEGTGDDATADLSVDGFADAFADAAADAPIACNADVDIIDAACNPPDTFGDDPAGMINGDYFIYNAPIADGELSGCRTAAAAR